MFLHLLFKTPYTNLNGGDSVFIICDDVISGNVFKKCVLSLTCSPKWKK